MACYQIDYAIEPNSLFTEIDKQKQVETFLQTFFNAYENEYLHQQKQNYCDVVKDVAGWDTVALQWKQFFYRIMGDFLPIEEYKKVERINQKVQRVFGRTSKMPHDKKFSSNGSQRKILVVSPFWNASDYVLNNVKSVASQDYDNYLHVLIDDCSEDDGLLKVQEYLEGLSDELKEKFVLIRNSENKGAIRNQLEVISEYAEKNDIVMLLDGDDWLVNNNTIFHYYNDLYDQGYEFTYGSMWSLADNIPLIAQDYPEKIKNKKKYREYFFNWKIPYTHLRTTLGEHFEKVDTRKFIEPETGEWMKSGADNPLFYELIENVKQDKIYCNKEIVCIYNDVNPLNDYKIRGDEQNENASLSYRKENTVKTILLAVPTNRYIEPETMKSIYDLNIPEGFKVEFQFFYGYQIDQIRNLTAEWAKNYDYMMCVDSDIVLPKDTLTKMLTADKDIITGLYIQRIPNTHTVEVYMDTPAGGMTNIPYELLKGRGIVEVAGCGFGVCLVKGEVFRKMEYPHFYYKSALDHKNTVSEDVYFCSKARALGFRVWADTSIKCDHKGAYTFKVETESKKTHLEKISEQDLLPKEHSEYLKTMNISPKVVYDIGACVHHWTNKAKQVWPDAEYYSIDAAQSVETFLEKNSKNYAIAVLSDKNGKVVDFYEDKDNPGGNSYYQETTGAFTDKHKTKRITVTLDSLVDQNIWKTPDLIKIDVQGAEIDVLRGAQETISQCQDIILEAQHTEYNKGAPKVNQVMDFMESIGYELVSNFCKNNVDGDYHFKKSLK